MPSIAFYRCWGNRVSRRDNRNASTMQSQCFGNVIAVLRRYDRNAIVKGGCKSRIGTYFLCRKITDCRLCHKLKNGVELNKQVAMAILPIDY